MRGSLVGIGLYRLLSSRWSTDRVYRWLWLTSSPEIGGGLQAGWLPGLSRVVGVCGIGGVVQRDLQWERELGVTGSTVQYTIIYYTIDVFMWVAACYC